MAQMKLFVIYIIVSALSCVSFAAQTGPKPSNGRSKAEKAQERKKVFDEISKKLPKEVKEKTNVVVAPVTQADRDDIDSSPKQAGIPYKYALVKNLPARIGKTDSFQGGVKDQNVWCVNIESEGSAATRVHFHDVVLSDGYEISCIGGEDGQSDGPFTESRGNDFWTTTFTGGDITCCVESTVPGGDIEGSGVSFDIDSILVAPASEQPERHLRSLQSPSWRTCFKNNPVCVEDAACYNFPADYPQEVHDARKAAGMMQFIDGKYGYLCSGGLIAANNVDTQPNYFLTANHCISTNKVATTLEVFFDFALSQCSSTGGCLATAAQSDVSGSTIVAKASSSDFCLLQLDQAPPNDQVFLGWNSSSVAFTDGQPLYRFSHGHGEPMQYSQHDVTTSAGTCGTLPRGNFIYTTDIVGAPIGGSSGSPVVNAAGQIVGQLYGVCGGNIFDDCDSVNNASVDGAFAASWTSVQPFLDPSDGSGGGGGGGGCDGLAGPGDFCNSDSECCNGKCKGPKNGKTCN